MNWDLYALIIIISFFMLYKFCEKFSETMIVNIIFSVSVFLLLANVLSTSNFFIKVLLKPT